MFADSIRYTRAIADEICERIGAGETLQGICRDKHMPSAGTVRGWVDENRDGFTARYACARSTQLEHFEDEIIRLGDSVLGTDNNAAVSAAKLAGDNRRWLMSKLRPDKYGERTAITGANGRDLIPDQAANEARILALLKKAGMTDAEARAALDADAG